MVWATSLLLCAAIAVAVAASAASVAGMQTPGYSNTVCIKNTDHTNRTLCTMCEHTMKDPCSGLASCQSENALIAGTVEAASCAMCKNITARHSDSIVRHVQTYCRVCNMFEDMASKALKLATGDETATSSKICLSICALDECTIDPNAQGAPDKSFPCRDQMKRHCPMIAPAVE